MIRICYNASNGRHRLRDRARPRLHLRRHDFPCGRVKVAIRPESVVLEPVQRGAGIRGTVTNAIYLGSHMEYMVETALGELFVIRYSTDSPMPSRAEDSVVFADRGVSLVRA